MSAASPKAQEPSMEEILASIRRIIADDQAKPAEAEAEAEPAVEDDVLDLAELAQPAPKPASAPEPDPFEAADVSFDDAPLDFDAIDVEPEPEPELEPPPPPPAPEPAAVAPPPPQPAPVEPEQLISRETDVNVSRTFGMLAHTVLSNNARTLEDLVGEMLRPMLKTWLDDNLPTIVERLVRAEIERVSRGR